MVTVSIDANHQPGSEYAAHLSSLHLQPSLYKPADGLVDPIGFVEIFGVALYRTGHRINSLCGCDDYRRAHGASKATGRTSALFHMKPTWWGKIYPSMGFNAPIQTDHLFAFSLSSTRRRMASDSVG
jgi:hypothetical protein